MAEPSRHDQQPTITQTCGKPGRYPPHPKRGNGWMEECRRVGEIVADKLPHPPTLLGSPLSPPRGWGGEGAHAGYHLS